MFIGAARIVGDQGALILLTSNIILSTLTWGWTCVSQVKHIVYELNNEAGYWKNVFNKDVYMTKWFTRVTLKGVWLQYFLLACFIFHLMSDAFIIIIDVQLLDIRSRLMCIAWRNRKVGNDENEVQKKKEYWHD